MKNYTAYIQWNTRKRLYAGFIPGIPDTEAWGDSMEDLKGNLRRILARRLKELRSSPRSSNPPRRSGFQRVDIRV
jgi:predicted RNase H-like HicB family nuclease